MSIRKKIILILIGIIVFYSTIQYGIGRLIILPSFSNLQHREAVKDIRRVKQLIARELSHLSLLTWDWSNWDDTYVFMKDHNSAYIESNLGEETFEGNQISLLYMLDLDGQVIWGKVYDVETGKDLVVDEFTNQSFGKEHQLLKHESLTSCIEGIWLTEYAPMLISSRPILSSNSEGPSRGTFVMGRFLDSHTIERISQDLSVVLRIDTLGSITAVNKHNDMLSRVSKENPYVVEYTDKELLHIYTIEPDVYDKPGILITVDIPTEILAEGRAAMTFAFSSILIAGAVIIFVIFWMIQKTVLSRLSKVSETINEVVEKQDFTIRTDIDGCDELGQLRDNLNNMLEYTANAEQTLQASEEKYRSIFEAATDGLRVGTLEGKTVQVNRACAEMHGYSKEEFLTLGPIQWIHPDSHHLFKQYVNSVRAGKAFNCEARDVRKDGSVFDVEIHGIPWRHRGQLHTLTVIRDITERKQLYEKLDRKQRNLEAIFDAAPLGMMLIDENGIVKRVNEVAAKLVHSDFPEIINRKLGEGLACIHASEHIEGCGNGSSCSSCPIRCTFESVLNSGQAIHNVEVRAAFLVDGQQINPWLQISAEPTIIDGTRFTVLAIQDITSRKDTEIELEKINMELEAAAEQARRLAEEATVATETKSKFLANMSHEIRTPMNAIIGFSQLLAEENLTSEQKEHVHVICESSQSLLKLINDILDFSRIEAGKMDINIEDCSLEYIHGRISTLIRPLALQKHLDFEIQVHEHVPLNIRTDPDRLQQCLVNLLSNAIKFTDEGHVYMKVFLECDNGESFVRFDIEDTGIGISLEKQEDIFESFTQADGSTTRRYGGTGLGLAITKQLAELLGGRITVVSKEGKGSVFSLVIPASVEVDKAALEDENSVANQVDNQNRIADQNELSGHVLVVEDVKTNQMLCKSMLNRMGLEVTIAEDGNDGVNKALVQDFDMILMDIQMPNMNGYEATKALREKGINTPIVALTANAMAGDDEKCIEAGCDGYLPKPIDRQQLLDIIRKYLSSEKIAVTGKSQSNNVPG